MPTGDFPDPEGMTWTDACGWVPKGAATPFVPYTPTEKMAWEALEKMARDINKDLPPDLHNYVVTISMSKNGVYATAIPREDTLLDVPSDTLGQL